MKIIDGHELAEKIKKAADKRRDSGLCILAGMVGEFVKNMPEAEAYTEARNRIENMEKIIEDQAERIEIMAANEVVHCKDCEHGYPLLPDYISCQISEENESGCHISHRPEWFCANGKRKEGEQHE